MSRHRSRHGRPRVLPSRAECAKGCRWGARCFFWNSKREKCGRTERVSAERFVMLASLGALPETPLPRSVRGL